MNNSRSDKIKSIVCISLLFSSLLWLFYLHVPSLKEGYLNAGDDHVHVAYANETKNIWEQEGRLLGWSRLYGMGGPIFLLRPPGFYSSVNLVHAISSLTIEQALKIIVVFGFCLFPLSIYIGARMLGMGRIPAAISGLLSPLCISMWGHTIDAYQHLGIHKQLLAILIFPVAVGALWQVLKNGRYGALFALSFAFMFMTHPYIAYCYALLSILMIPAMAAYVGNWHFTWGMKQAILWSVPSVLLIFIWLIPFMTSPEIQFIDPYLSRRYYFEVVGSTTAETVRQYLLGGILDTTYYSGVFGGTQWTGGNEWGWLDNSAWPRFPIITFFSFVGLVMAAVSPKTAKRGFLGLAFILSFLLLTGPDDFPFLDKIPFAKKFQNIHAVFMFEWAAIMLAGMAIHEGFIKIRDLNKRYIRAACFGAFGALVIFGFSTAYYERTCAAQKMVDLRNVYTKNGAIVIKKNTNPQWMAFNEVVQQLETDPVEGNIAAFPQVHEDSVIYNLLPPMVNRSVSISGFETLGGVYSLMLHKFRTALRDNYHLQQLFNIRFVVNSPFLREEKLNWHQETEKILENEFWELIKVKGDFGKLQVLSPWFIGFSGSEREWEGLMEIWLDEVRKNGFDLPWIINFTHSGMKEKDLAAIKPYISHILYGKDAKVPDRLIHIPKIELGKMSSAQIREDVFVRWEGEKRNSMEHLESPYWEAVQNDRKADIYQVFMEEPITPVLFKQAFYRGWEARIDREKVALYRISPGLQMVLVPKGKHELVFSYTGPNHWKTAMLSFGLGIFIICLLVVWKRIFKKAAKRKNLQNKTYPDLAGKFARAGIRAVWIIFIVMVCFQVVSEAYYKKPVVIHPKNGQVIDQEKKTIFWNYVAGVPVKAQVFDVEIAKDKDFNDIVLAQKVQKNKFQPNLSKTEQGTYFYRLRLVLNGKPYNWSHPEKLILWQE